MRHVVWAALGGVLLLSGCLTSPAYTPIAQYRIELADPVEAANPRAHTGSLGLRPLTAAPALSRDMNYIEDNGRWRALPNAQWAEPPAAVAARALHDGLAASGAFEDVGVAADMSLPDYVLTGELRHFEVDRRTEPATAHVAFTYNVRRALAADVLAAGEAAARAPLPSDDAPGFAAGLKAALAEALAEATRDITAAVQAQAP